MSTEKKGGLVRKLADKYSVQPESLFATLKVTAFKQPGQNALPPTNEQMMALLIVADQYDLNPFTREIFAFPGKRGEITPVVSVDGWSRIINEHPAMDGIEFEYSDKMHLMPGAKHCHTWVEAVIYRKDRKQPIRVREYLDEAYQGPRNGYAGAWQTHTKRMLRHKALIQGSRIAFGFAGLYDMDEAQRIADMGNAEVLSSRPFAVGADDAQSAEVVYQEIGAEEKQRLDPMLDTLCQRALDAGAWEAARQFAEERLSQGELQYALKRISEAEAEAEAGAAEEGQFSEQEQAPEQELAEQA